jgi:hypothetical protein
MAQTATWRRGLFAGRALALAAGVAGCSGGAGGPEGLDQVAVAPYGDLETLVRDLYIPGAGSNQYVPPTASELQSFEHVLAAIDARAYGSAAREASSLGYDLQHLVDPGGADLVVLVEKPATLRGGGTFVVDTKRTSNRVVEVPHPISDNGTLEEGVALFNAAHAGALLVAGVHRCASPVSTTCTGADATNACAGRLRQSDAAHFSLSYFEVAHEAWSRRWATSVAISLHTHADTTNEAAVMVSAGTREGLGSSAASNHLRDGLNAAGFTTVSCNTSADPPPRLCGESNVQGRFSNGASDACQQDAVHASGTFLHVEQSVSALKQPAQLVAAIAAGF